MLMAAKAHLHGWKPTTFTPSQKGGQSNLSDGATRCRPDNHAKGNQLNGWWNATMSDSERAETEPADGDDCGDR